MNRKSTFIAIVLLSAACTFNVKPIYNDKEQAKAEAAVAQFHSWYNDRRTDLIYGRLDDKADAQTKEQFLSGATMIFLQRGKLLTARLDQAKVSPSNPIQVKLLYNSKFEVGNVQEWFTWNIYGEDVRLFEYRVTPGWDK